DAQGNLLGVSKGGGTNSSGGIYQLTPSNGSYTQTLIQSFPSGSNAAGSALFSDSIGNFYGEVQVGGSNGYGFVYKLTPNNGTYTYSVIYNFFGGLNDGADPFGNLYIDSQGNIFGLTSHGGNGSSPGYGTVYKLAPNGNGYTETVLYKFNGGTNDGSRPIALYSDGQGNFYGTTKYGGTFTYGTVFQLIVSGNSYTENVIHSFAGQPNDGANPYGLNLLIDSSGNLYGTTSSGGASRIGAIFKLTPSNGSYTESITYSFNGIPNDGSSPYNGLSIDTYENIYGIASGGTNNTGVIYKFSTATNTESVIYNFGASNSTVPVDPSSGLYTDSSGKVFGITKLGGTNNTGTVYQIQ
ncbi:MAG TPA: hypothetical protein PLQ34_03105, partial [Ferrovaceae bacterium]|nr:hypothetical protein [Ferrovaceae bacterium]